MEAWFQQSDATRHIRDACDLLRCTSSCPQSQYNVVHSACWFEEEPHQNVTTHFQFELRLVVQKRVSYLMVIKVSLCYC